MHRTTLGLKSSSLAPREATVLSLLVGTQTQSVRQLVIALPITDFYFSQVMQLKLAAIVAAIAFGTTAMGTSVKRQSAGSPCIQSLTASGATFDEGPALVCNNDLTCGAPTVTGPVTVHDGIFSASGTAVLGVSILLLVLNRTMISPSYTLTMFYRSANENIISRSGRRILGCES